LSCKRSRKKCHLCEKESRKKSGDRPVLHDLHIHLDLVRIPHTEKKERHENLKRVNPALGNRRKTTPKFRPGTARQPKKKEDRKRGDGTSRRVKNPRAVTTLWEGTS